MINENKNFADASKNLIDLFWFFVGLELKVPQEKGCQLLGFLRIWDLGTPIPLGLGPKPIQYLKFVLFSGQNPYFLARQSKENRILPEKKWTAYLREESKFPQGGINLFESRDEGKIGVSAEVIWQFMENSSLFC
jgi:hypothetical protein